MAPHQAESPSTLLDPASAAMGELLADVWREGTLVLPLGEDAAPLRLPGLHKSVLPASLSGQARVTLAGVGERFAAWRVIPQQNAPVIVRIPHVTSAELHQDLAHEIAALTLLPAEVGPEPIAVHGDPATSPIGHPYVVTSEIQGIAASPATWTGAHLQAHAAHLALLHAVPAPGRGPVSLGTDPWAAVAPGPQSLLPEVEEEIEAWQLAHGAAIQEHRLGPLLEAAHAMVAAVDGEIAQLDGFVLAHGDLCATNILWHGVDEVTGAPQVQYIDFEWAQGDDPARDLANLGGAVHGGPWYVPLTEDQVDGFVRTYVQARGEREELPDSVADMASLRRRMRAWTAYERSAMLVHVASRASTRSTHRRVLPILQRTLAAALDVDL